MAPKPEIVNVENQATNFAEQFIQALMSGGVGYATPLQRNIGGAYESLIAQGPQFFDTSKGFDALKQRFDLTSSTGRADVAEKFSIGGSRYGTATGTGIMLSTNGTVIALSSSGRVRICARRQSECPYRISASSRRAPVTVVCKLSTRRMISSGVR